MKTLKKLFLKIAKLLGLDLDLMYESIADLKKKVSSLDRDLDDIIDNANATVECANENTRDIENILLRLRLNNLITEEQYRVFYTEEKEDKEE